MDPLVRLHSGQMRRSEDGGTSSAPPDATAGETRYVGVRRRRWGKWVSEIRVPGTGDRLWLGSYSTPEAAAVAHDAAVFFLRGPACSRGLNFPDRVAGFAWSRLSPQSVQKVASEWGMAVDAGRLGRSPEAEQPTPDVVEAGGMEDAIWGEISVDDMEIYDM